MVPHVTIAMSSIISTISTYKMSYLCRAYYRNNTYWPPVCYNVYKHNIFKMIVSSHAVEKRVIFYEFNQIKGLVWYYN